MTLPDVYEVLPNLHLFLPYALVLNSSKIKSNEKSSHFQCVYWDDSRFHNSDKELHMSLEDMVFNALNTYLRFFFQLFQHLTSTVTSTAVLFLYYTHTQTPQRVFVSSVD